MIMKTMTRSINGGLFRFVLALVALLLSCAPTFAAFFPLEITNINPAGEGTPVLPATNRIFKAYPGIEYNIRAAVVGGVYPYTYSLSNAPSGMTINSRTGEITWPNPQTDSGTIMLSVTDSESETVSTSWAIIVSTSGFRFVDASYSGTETGSIDQPYRSLDNFLTATYNGTETDIVYFKSGTYPMVDHNSSADYVMNLEKNPRTWLAYPGATVAFQGGSGTAQDANRIYTMASMYFDGLEFKDMVNFGVNTGNGALYKTIRRCKFDGLVPSDNINNNYGFVYISRSFAGRGYGSVIQDNEFTQWAGASAVGSIYGEDKMLIENNNIHDPLASSTYSGISTVVGIAPKVENDYMTIRGNAVKMDRGYLMGGINSAFYQSNYNEICFNLFVNTGTLNIGTIWDWEIGKQGLTKYWRNTTIASIAHKASSNTGPYIYNDNVISNSEEPFFWDHKVTGLISHPPSIALSAIASVSNNLTDTTASNLVDANNDYKLVPTQSAYVGSRGWQFADGTTPMEGVQSTPSPSARRLSLGGRPIKLAEPGP